MSTPRRWMVAVRTLPAEMQTDAGLLSLIREGRDEETVALLQTRYTEVGEQIEDLRAKYPRLASLVGKLDRIDRDWIFPYFDEGTQSALRHADPYRYGQY